MDKETKQLFDQFEKRSERVEEMLGTLIQMVGNMNARLEETQADVREIKDGQERQDRILEMLSVKSIETDSYISL